MGKVIILEYTKILSMKIKTLLTQTGFTNVEIVNINSTFQDNLPYLFKDADIIFIDLDNHNINVIDLIKSIKKNNKTMDIPIISLSTSSDIVTIKKMISYGCFDFIVKPFDGETLIRKVLKVLPNSIFNDSSSNNLLLIEDELLGDGDISLNWTDDFKIGIESLDEEHKTIINKYNKLYLLMIAGQGHESYDELLDFLYKYVNTHFEHEEQFQQEIGYDKCVEHKKIHDKFRMQVNEMIENKKNKPATNMELIHINLFIKDWLIHHILITDKKIKIFLNSR